jgi:hypothetical protein
MLLVNKFFIFLIYFLIHSAHINHIRNIAGIDSVGLGGDFDGIDAYVLFYFDFIFAYITIIVHRMTLTMSRNIRN